MTLQMGANHNFTPLGWMQVQGEAVKRERKLKSTSSMVSNQILDQYMGNYPPAGWAWFAQAGFHDAFDKEPLVKRNFPQRPHGHPDRAAGLAPVQVSASNNLKHRNTGRHCFMERHQPSDLKATMTLPDGGLGHTKRPATLSLPAPGLPTPVAPGSVRSISSSQLGRSPAGMRRSVSESTLRLLG
mmetsp:Transcript_39225/g.61123  ORF Transcript_39225/g.61123 Transcript_39225/m.61123 type:complete len:185 (-) Transcript_39225:98-652(-)